MDIKQPSVGIFLAGILQNFGLTIDDNLTTGDKLVFSDLNSDNIDAKCYAEIVRIDKTKKAFKCGGELVFTYDVDHIYLAEPIKSHDLICKIMSLCGWKVTDISDDKVDDHFVKVSSALSPVTYNVVLILSDHDNGIISETRINYLNKILLSIRIKDDNVIIYTEHKHYDAVLYKIVVEK